jgi:hypothetical protein
MRTPSRVLFLKVGLNAGTAARPVSGLFVSAHARGANRAVIFLLKRVCAYQSTAWSHKRPVAGAMSGRQTQDRVAKDGSPY